MSDFMWFEEVNPVEKAQKTAKAVEAVRTELEDRGIIAFVMNADSLPEAEQRLAMREVNATIDDVVERHMPEDEGAKARLVSSIFRQFKAGDGEFGGYELRAPVSGPGTFNNPDLDPSTFQRRPGNTRDQDFAGFLENGGKRQGICPGDGFIHGVSGQDRCGLHGGMTALRFDDPHPELAALARDLHEEREHQFKTRKYPVRSGEAQDAFVKKWEDHIQMKRDGGIQQSLPGFEAKVKESTADPSCTRCNGTGTLSDGSHCTCVAPAYDDSGMKNAAKDDDMPMKDGKPAFLDDDDSDDSDDDDSDDDDDDKKKKKKKKKDDDEDDDDDEDEDSEESDDDDSSKKEGSVHLAAGISRSCRLGGHDCQGCECSCHMSEGGPLTDDVDDGLYDPMEFEQ